MRKDTYQNSHQKYALKSDNFFHFSEIERIRNGKVNFEGASVI